MWPNPQYIADLVIFTEELLDGKLNFFCVMWTENRWKEKFGKDWSLVSYGYGFKCIYDNFFGKQRIKFRKYCSYVKWTNFMLNTSVPSQIQNTYENNIPIAMRQSFL